MISNAIIFSIQPKFAELILNGSKTVELRRVLPKRISIDTFVLLYVSAPVKQISCGFWIDDIVQAPVNELWIQVSEKAGISQNEYDKYFEGSERGFGLFVKDVISLKITRENIISFTPPQSFCYLSMCELQNLSEKEPRLTRLLDV